MKRLPLLATLLLIAVLGLTACGDDKTTTTEAEATTSAEESAGGSESANGEEADLNSKPEVEVPEGGPPEELQTIDIVEGDGEEARSGDLVTVQYVGVSYSDGEEFDASWDRGQPFPFTLGAGQVIEGWDEAVAGMKVGGRRELIIPPDQAYGRQGSPPVIGRDETLIFVVDLLAVN